MGQLTRDAPVLFLSACPFCVWGFLNTAGVRGVAAGVLAFGAFGGICIHKLNPWSLSSVQL